VDAAAEIVGTAAALTVVGALELWVKPALSGGLGCDPVAGERRCRRQDLSAIDRTVVGNHSGTWSAAGDWLVAGVATASLAGVVGGAFAAQTDTPGTDALTDVLVWSEAVASTLFAVQLFKFAVRRPRPTQYDAALVQDDPDATLSFPSGHTASVAAASAAAASTFAYRNPESPWRWVVSSAAAVLVGVTAYARVGAGKHFYTDVLTGAVLGGALGWLVPHLHRNQQLSVSATGTGDAAALRALSLRFAF
jgi:membrane-associated phospholipid phosphatase